MDLKHSNVETIFVATGFPENRSNLCRKVGKCYDEEINTNEDSDLESKNEQIEIEGRRGKFAMVDSIHTKYSKRPEPLEKICLAQFASFYKTCAKPNKSYSFDNGVSEERGDLEHFITKERLPKFIELKDGGYMHLREKPFILQIHAFKKKKENEGIFAELLLFFPWRNENDIRQNCITIFNENYDIIKKNKETIYPKYSMVDIMRDLMDNPENSRPIHLGDMDTAGEQENLDDEETLEPLDTSEVPDESDSTEIYKNVVSDACSLKP